MRQSLLLFCLVASFFSATSKDSMKVRVVSSSNHRPVPFVSLTMEYPDTIISFMTDRKGKLTFSPSSFPLTVTAHAEGMTDATFGIMSAPEKTLTIEISPDPARMPDLRKRRVDWASDRPSRLSSTYVVRNKKN